MPFQKKMYFKELQADKKKITYVEPEICKGKESNLVDPEEVPHCLTGSQKDHLAIQPAKYKEKKPPPRGEGGGGDALTFTLLSKYQSTKNAWAAYLHRVKP